MAVGVGEVVSEFYAHFCGWLYVHMYTCSTYTCIKVPICRYICMYTCIWCIHTYVHSYWTHVYIRTYTYALYSHTYASIVRVHVYIRMPVYVHIYLFISTCTCTCVHILYTLLLCTHLRWVPSDVIQWGCETYRTRTGHFGGIHLSHDFLPVTLLHRTR